MNIPTSTAYTQRLRSGFHIERNDGQVFFATLAPRSDLLPKADQVNIRFGQSHPYAYITASENLTSEEQGVGQRMETLLGQLAQLKAAGGIETDWREPKVRKFTLDGQEYAARSFLDPDFHIVMGPINAWRRGSADQGQNSVYGLLSAETPEPGIFLKLEPNGVTLIEHKTAEHKADKYRFVGKFRSGHIDYSRVLNDLTDIFYLK